MATNAAANETDLAEVHRMALLGRMLAAVVHELNTPLASLTSNNQTALRTIEKLKVELEERADHARPVEGERIEKAAHLADSLASLAAVDRLACERMAAVIRSLRPFSRTDARDLRRVQLQDLLDDALKLVQWTYRRRITVERDYGGLPDIECVPQALSQVFLNLLANAGQAIEGDGRVIIRTRAQDDSVRVSISDSGKGVRPEDLPRIFSPGFSTRPPGEGAGLGLAISREIVVDAHGGSLECESQPGAGATFHVTLPIRQKKHAN